MRCRNDLQSGDGRAPNDEGRKEVKTLGYVFDPFLFYAQARNLQSTVYDLCPGELGGGYVI